MGTVSGLRTRRYHGLLVVAGDVPARRMVAVAALDPILTLPSGARISLATHEWGSGTIAPMGHELLESFELLDGLPRWRWRVGNVVLERVVGMRHGTPSLAATHTLLAGGPVTLTVEALCTWRDAHGERHAADGLAVESTSDGAIVEGAYRLAGPGFTADRDWYFDAYLRAEAERGLAPNEDLCRIGWFSKKLDPGESLDISAWAGDRAALATAPPPPREVILAARSRAAGLVPPGTDAAEATLRRSADSFIVTTPAGPDVVAGYPWFGAWSRDTMIAYEGLFLSTGRVDQGRDLLHGYARTLSEGMLANTADTGQTEYNTADATLWFLHAVDRHVTATGDDDLAARVIGPLDQIIDWHRRGTRFGLRIDPADGLLTQGADGYALTWMDAVIHSGPVTQRRGKAVELNALWINGLRGLAELHRRLGQDPTELLAHGATATESFRRRFPAPRGWLYDVVDAPVAGEPVQSAADASLRPNQLLAYGLPYAPMRGTDPGPVRAAADSLLTPLGLRSLAPAEVDFHPRHRGDPASRDRAYHQGTVWPWLIGPYADAARAVGLPTDGLLDGLVAHLGEWGVGSVSETADGEAPHDATGCPFQAWSVAEMLRIYRQG
jgi:predicted glycogen debranching enzyme